MLVVLLVTICLVALTTLIHYHVLSMLNLRLPQLKVRSRTKVLAVLFATFLAHCVEIVIYGLAMYVLLAHMGIGGLSSTLESSVANSIYLSAEAYTSIGFGPAIPVGEIRLLIAAEALNGLLLIGWSASYAFIAMERYWEPKVARREP